MGGGEDPPAAGGLGRRFLVGGLYVGLGNWGVTLLRFGSNIALARLLGPELLGFYAFVYSVNEMLNVMCAFSPMLALMQAPESSPEHEDTAFAIDFWLGLGGLAASGLAAAVLLSRGASGLAAILVVLLGGGRALILLGDVAVAKLERGLRYREIAVVNVVSGVLPSVAAVVLAWLGAGVWALLAQDLLIATTLFVLPMVFSGYRYAGRTDREIRAGFLAFGRSMFGSRALEIAMQRVDRLTIAASMGDVRLGLYHQARILSETGLAMGRPLSRMAFNLYARVQHDADRLARGFGLTNFFIVRLMFAGATSLAVFPDETVRLLLGDAWSGAAPLLWILSVHAALLPVFENAKEVLLGRGHPRRVVALRLVQLLVLVAGLAAAAALGDVRVAAAALSAATLVGLFLVLRASRDVTRGVLRRDFLVPVLCLAPTFALRLEPVLSLLAPIPELLLPFVPPIVYLAFLLLLDRRQLTENLQMLRGMVRPA